jgi:hypothetical protein
MIISRLAVVLVLFEAGAVSACTATADPPGTTPTSTDKSGGTGTFPDMSGYAAVNPDDYAHHFETAGRPGAVMTNHLFTPPTVSNVISTSLLPQQDARAAISPVWP